MNDTENVPEAQNDWFGLRGGVFIDDPQILKM